MNIYIGNISRDLSEDELREAFAAYGQVSSVNIIKDKFTGEYRGFAFVEMPVKEEAEAEDKILVPAAKGSWRNDATVE